VPHTLRHTGDHPRRGGTTRRRTIETSGELTAQEAVIARLGR